MVNRDAPLQVAGMQAAGMHPAMLLFSNPAAMGGMGGAGYPGAPFFYGQMQGGMQGGMQQRGGPGNSRRKRIVAKKCGVSLE